MKILVTGGFGYLGGRLAAFLSDQTPREIFLGSRRTPTPPCWLPQVNTVQTQWDSSVALEDICMGVDVVVHAAGMNAQECVDNPVAALDVNAVATARLLRSAVRQKVKRFVYISTAHVYGSPLTGSITEDSCPVNMHPYATSHRAGEDVVRAAHQCREIEGIVIRLSNAFGVPLHKDINCWMLLVNDLCRQAVTTRRLVLHSSGLQWRDFITLSDTVRAIDHIIECPSTQLGDGLFNLGGMCSLRVVDIAERIAQRCYTILGFRPPIQRSQENTVSKPQSLNYQIDKLLRTGFELKGSIDSEIDETLKFCVVSFGEAI